MVRHTSALDDQSPRIREGQFPAGVRIRTGSVGPDGMGVGSTPKAPGLCVLLLSGPALCLSESQSREEGHGPVPSDSHLPALRYPDQVSSDPVRAARASALVPGSGPAGRPGGVGQPGWHRGPPRWHRASRGGGRGPPGRAGQQCAAERSRPGRSHAHQAHWQEALPASSKCRQWKQQC